MRKREEVPGSAGVSPAVGLPHSNFLCFVKQAGDVVGAEYGRPEDTVNLPLGSAFFLRAGETPALPGSKMRFRDETSEDG